MDQMFERKSETIANLTTFATHNDARLRKLVDSQLVGIGCGDKSGLFTYVNDKFLDLIGYSRAEVQSLRWAQITPPEYHAIDQAHLIEAVNHGHCTPYEKEYIRKDGVRIPILIGFTWTGELDQQFVGFVIDLTAQKKAEAESEASELKFRFLAESLPQMIFTTDANGMKTYCSSRYLEYAGCSSIAEMHKAWTNLVHPDDRSRAAEAWKQSILTGVSYQAEYRMRRHDGAYRYHVARAVPTRDQGDAIDGWVGSITDIHDTKQAEELLRRTEKLSAAARIAASLAHEVNNPLASVTNTLYLALQDQNISPTTRQYLRLADQELRRVAQVTTQTLRFHKQSTPPRSADLAALIDASLSTYSRRLQAGETQVVREFKPGLILYCLADEMLQAFGHLLSNSIDAMGTGGKLRIRIARARRWDASMTTGIRVTIADNGKGIPEHFLPRIFEAFTSTKDPTGTGLGMWLVDGVVRKHDGRIAIRTSTGPHHGTVVSLFFPYIGVTDVTA